MPAPKKSGSALETLAVSVLPVLERHAEPLVVKMTVEAVFVKPDHGAQLFAAGTAKPGPTKVVPPLPKPPDVAMQRGPPPERSGRGEVDGSVGVDKETRLHRGGGGRRRKHVEGSLWRCGVIAGWLDLQLEAGRNHRHRGRVKGRAAELDELRIEAFGSRGRAQRRKRTCPFSIEVPVMVIVPSTVRVAVGAVVPMPTEVPLSKIRELTMVFDPENLATLFAVPPVVVTVVTALGVIPFSSARSLSLGER